jgi:hypothetical protein
MVQWLGAIMIFFPLLYFAQWWIQIITDSSKEFWGYDDDALWLIETTLTAGTSLAIGGLIAEQIARKKDE